MRRARCRQRELEHINSERLQLKFARRLPALPPPIRACVDVLHRAMVAACGGEADAYVLQDCYALLTPADDTNEEARAPQRWHLDAISRFPVAALVLRGRRATQFTAGRYSDLSEGVAPSTLERWIAPLKSISARTWESDSPEVDMMLTIDRSLVPCGWRLAVANGFSLLVGMR